MALDSDVRSAIDKSILKIMHRRKFMTQADNRPSQEETLAEIEKDFGFAPNLLKEMSKSPAAPLVYTKTEHIMKNAYLDAKEQQVVQLVVSLFNGCNYCSSMHSKFSKVNGLSHEDVLAIRRGEYPEDKGIGNLVWLTRTILEKRGHLTTKDLEIVENMGIDRARLYEILAHIGRKMIANYAVHIIDPELDEVFEFEE
jgi:AhpD family alkylhydroperoxidase